MGAKAIGDYVISAHAALEMARRGIDLDTVTAVMAAPEQRLAVRAGRIVLQSRVTRSADQKTVLVRVFVDIDRTPADVVTVYATTKIAKYWSPGDES